ncbi:AAEL011007-PA [Aedes aegypti]|uniref:AAEL011007-PA n=2 Tax=Aedes aegypti TaxID=7159 RepID=A0A1S4FS25_AEDAE|nr:ficolin-1 [Aedes aegypti]EAT36947.1 AAEL011007-PA [Aedes aegypti]
MSHFQLALLGTLFLLAVQADGTSSCSGFGYELLTGKMEALEAEILNIGKSVVKVNHLMKSIQCADSVYASCDKVPTKESGVYRVKTNLHEVTEVLCDQEYDGGGWTVIQNRFDGSVNFYRDWSEYKRGFGTLDAGEFWLGLDVIHQLTYSAPHELVVLLEDFDGNSTYAKWDRFEVAGEQSSYTVTLAEGFSGPAGDSFTGTKAAKFSTLDRDNDTWGDSCAVTYHGAWWYTACHSSNLNGKYSKGNTTEYATGMVWYTFRGHHYALKSSRMMIRRKKL